MELSPKQKHIEFDRVLRSKSINQDDPISEWRYLKILPIGIEVHPGDAVATFKCICTQPIHNLHYIENKISGLILHIGCECIKRWSALKPTCNHCNITLGALSRRRKENDWLCASCCPANQTISFDEPNLFYGMRFRKAVQSTYFVEKYLNRRILNDNHQLFLDYAVKYWNDKGYDIKELPVPYQTNRYEV